MTGVREQISMDTEVEHAVPAIVDGFAPAGDSLASGLDSRTVRIQTFRDQTLLYGDVIYFGVRLPHTRVVFGNVSMDGNIFVERPAYKNVVDHDVIDAAVLLASSWDGIE